MQKPTGARVRQRHKYRAERAVACPRCLLVVGEREREWHPADCGGELVRLDSKAEAYQYARLLMQERAGTITDLRRQVAWPIYAGGKVVGRYLADFTYLDAHGRTVVEDVKGYDTDLSRFKRKCVEHEHGVRVHLIDRKGRPKA